MYRDWVSLSVAVHDREAEMRSVLSRLPPPAGQTVVSAVVRHLASTLGITAPPQPSPLTSAAEVDWCMQVICHGLSLRLSEHDTIRDCVNVYCEWLTVLSPAPKLCVPRAVAAQPNLYARRMLNHLQHLFVPRSGQSVDTVNRQAVLCHRVLRTVQTVTQSELLDTETWHTLLLFLLTVNDSLLAPPTVKDDIGDQMYERVLSVLFEVWIAACCKSFPPPPLWKTFRESCLHWRHRPGLVERWSCVMQALTCRLLQSMYGPMFASRPPADDDPVPADMPAEAVAQTWYRMLHTIGDPVDLSSAVAVSSTQQFLQYAISSESVIEPHQHPCLSQLPAIFHRAVRAVAALASALLGVVEPEPEPAQARSEPSSLTSSTGTVTPPVQRRPTRGAGAAGSANKGSRGSIIGGLAAPRGSVSSGSGSVEPAPSAHAHPPLTASVSVPTSPPAAAASSAHPPLHRSGESPGPGSGAAPPHPPVASAPAGTPLSAGRPKCNSILHLLGTWLFEAALVGTSAHSSAKRTQGQTKRASAAYLDSRKSSTSSQTPEPAELPTHVTADKFERGRAEALGALCRVFCAKKTGEDILPSYLASFYLVVHEALTDRESAEVSPHLAAVLLHSPDLLLLDLDGVNCLLPALTDALQHVLASPRPLTVRDSDISAAALRRASIRLLVSALALPLHYQSLVIREPVSTDRPQVSFLQLRPRLVGLLITGLQQDTDPTNCQMMLGGLMLCIQDSAFYEETAMGVHEMASPGQPPAADSARGLYVRTVYLVCHRLMSAWKSELSVSLAALELLTGLARLHILQDGLECRRAVRWLCDYICHQCSRPPPAHSKDLHSTIVAAFRCVSVWLLEHPYLLDDGDTLATLLEVIELGISGSSSQAKYGEPPVMKHEKELKPASMRVKEAAESLLYVLMEQVDHFPSASGVSSLSSHLTEAALLQHCQPGAVGLGADRHTQLKQFKYFVCENLLIALLEQPLGNDEDPQPTVTCLMRGPSLRTAWMLQLRHLPRHKAGARPAVASNPGRPLPMSEPPARAAHAPAFFPESVERIPFCRADRSIPVLESLAQEQRTASEINTMLQLMQQQQLAETEQQRRPAIRTASGPNLDTECCPPPARQEFQTARLFLSHFQLLDDAPPAEHGRQVGWQWAGRQLVALDAQKAGFAADLDALDNTSFRSCDTAHVYYVTGGSTEAAAVLSNGANIGALPSAYCDFLLSVGWPVEVASHAGWTGRAESAIAARDDRPAGEYDGRRRLLYWADALSELAVLVPSSAAPANTPIPPPRAAALTLASTEQRRARGGSETEQRRARGGGAELPVLVVWLESFDDLLNFPADELCGVAEPHIIFVHALQNQLYRISLHGPAGKMTFATPLIDGLVVSRATLGPLVRHTITNVCARRRLESDNSQPAYVRRKQRIQEMVTRYGTDLSQPEFFTSLFTHDPTNW